MFLKIFLFLQKLVQNLRPSVLLKKTKNKIASPAKRGIKSLHPVPKLETRQGYANQKINFALPNAGMDTMNRPK